MTKAPKLKADDWIAAGFRALTKGGPQAIRAEAIARDLKVSKGSFYWHFKDLNDLKTRMIAFWQQVATQGIIDIVEAHSDDPAHRLHYLITVCCDDRAALYGGAMAESAIRDWGLFAPEVAQVVSKIDAQRLRFVTQQFVDIGFESGAARLRANGLYAALIGLEKLQHAGLANMQNDLTALLDLQLMR